MSAFVGRERELEILLAGLSDLTAGRGSLFLLSGEPGIGKTRLAEELLLRAQERGVAVARGAAWDGGDAPTFWPWIEVMRALRQKLPEPDAQMRRDLGPLWQDGSAPGDDAMRDPELARFRRFDALRTLLQMAASHAPLMIFLDDLHAADQASLQALQFIARAVRTLPILIVGTHRDAEARANPAVGDLLARIARLGRTLPLSRLTRDEVSRLLAGLEPVSARLVDQVFETSGGNPLFVDETVRLVRSGGRPETIPTGVDAIIRDRLSRFEPATRAVLDAAAVLGREVQWPVLAQVCDLTGDKVRQHVRAAYLAGVIDNPNAAVMAFSHALFRQRLYEDLTPERRAELHLRCGAVLARAGAAAHAHDQSVDAAAESVALHLLLALPRGDLATAIDWAIRAGDAAMRAFAFDRAVAVLESALSARAGTATDPAQSPAQTIDIELRLAYALSRSGQSERSRQLCLAAAAQARALGDAPRLAAAALAYGSELRIAVVDDTLVTLLAEALRALGDANPDLRARVMARLAAAQQPSANPEIPMQLARDAIALARTVGNETLLATLHMAGSALVDYASPQERLPLSRELCALALPRGELTIAQQGYARLAIDLLELNDVAGADAAISAHVQLGEALGHPRWRWRGALFRSMRALLQGDFEESARARAEAAALVAQADDTNAAALLAVHTIASLREREIGSAREFATYWDLSLESLEYSAQIGVQLRASLAVRCGDIAVARHILATLPDDRSIMALDPVSMLLYAEVIAGVGDRDLVRKFLPAVQAFAGRTLTWGVFGLIWEGPANQWIGRLLAVLERWDEAIAALEDALATAQDLGARPLCARTQHELARVRLLRGDQEDARHAAILLDQAAATATALGMTHLIARVQATRARLPDVRAMSSAVAPAAVSFSLAREGDTWLVAYGERSTRLRHSRALEILDELARNPGREFHVLDLSTDESSESATTAIDLGDAGPQLDPTARRAYERRIADLRDELELADAWADSGRRDRVRAELEFVQDELARAVGLGGRDRRAAGAVERARVNLQKRLRGVIRKIGETLPELARHLDKEVKTGTYISYRAS